MDHRFSRKDFLQAIAALLGVHVLGCGDDGPARPDGGGGGGDGGTGTDGGGGGTDGGGDTDAGGGDTDAGGGDTDGGGTNACEGDFIDAVIGSNHDPGPHALRIPVADIIAGVAMTYTTGGTRSHCHSVSVSAEDFATLRAGGEVRLYSCNNTDHEYVLSCAGTPTSDAESPIPICAELGGSHGTGSCG